MELKILRQATHDMPHYYLTYMCGSKPKSKAAKNKKYGKDSASNSKQHERWVGQVIPGYGEQEIGKEDIKNGRSRAKNHKH